MRFKASQRKATLIPNDGPFIWLVYAPPNSGKSTFVANVILDKRWGFSGRRKNLITKEAAKGADDNPYDPKVLDDPDTKCFPVEKLKDAEAVFNDHIAKYEPKDGEDRQLTIIDDYGSEINDADITGKKGWLKIAGEHLRKKAQYFTDLIIILQCHDHNPFTKQLCTHVSLFMPMLTTENDKWTEMMGGGVAS